MTINHPKDIKIGQHYYNPFIGEVAMGCGQRVIGTSDEFTNKQLILENGMFVQQGDNASPHIWEWGFEEVSEDYVPDSFAMLAKID